MSVFQIVLDFLNVLIWPLLVLLLSIMLIKRLDIWLGNKIATRNVEDEATQEPQLPEFLQSSLSKALRQERETLQSAQNADSKNKLKVLDQYTGLVQDAGTDAIGLGLLQAGGAGLPIEGILRTMVQGENPNLNPRVYPIVHLRAMQARAERLVSALQDIGLVTFDNEHYWLTPYGKRLFEKILKDRTDFETKFYGAFGSSNSESMPDDSRHIFSVQNGTDDASESPGDIPCPFSVSDENIYIGDCSPSQPITAGLRFVNVDIPQQATIRESYLEFIADGPYSNLIATVIQAEDSPNPNSFSDQDRPQNRPVIAISIAWRISSRESWTLGQVHRTPDVSPLIQAIVNLQEWKPGNALVILIRGTAGGDSGAHRRFIGFVRGTEDAEYMPPRLIVEYRLPIDDSGTLRT